MNQVTNEQKESTIKVLAIVGFLAAIVLLVFIAVKVVSYIPAAFSSLASIADSVYNYDRNPTLAVSTPNSVVPTGETFVLTWNEVKRPGTFSFSYTCADGAAVDIRTAEGEIVALDCDTTFSLEKDQTSLEVMAMTEKQRFTDIAYTLVFTPSDPREEQLSTGSRVTIVNASIPTSGAIVEETPAPEVTEPVTPTEPETGVVAGETTTTPTPRPLVPPAPTYTEQVIYAIPTSNPNGVIDLRVTFVGVGEGVGNNFTPRAALATNKTGAIRFSVKNIGTKTAEDWSFVADLPSDITYTSKDQAPLKPNEEAIITLEFAGIDRTGIEAFGVKATAKGDVNTNNNRFTWAVNVVN